MTEKGLSSLSLNIIQIIFEYLPRLELFEFHLANKRINRKYWEHLSLQCFHSESNLQNPIAVMQDLPLSSVETLLNIVALTKQHIVLSRLASASMTTLCKAGHNFCSVDLSNTSFPGADMSNGVFQYIDFSYSNLNSCNFSRAFISHCCFFRASLKRTHFGSKIVTGHLQTINSLVISDDKKLLVSSGYDRLIKLWELPTFKLIKTLKGLHNGPISALCLSTDNSYLLSSEQNIRLWDLADGVCKLIEGHTKKITGLSMSNGNGFFVSSSQDGTIKIWKTETCKCKATIKLENAVLSVMMSPDAKVIIAGGKGGEVALYNCAGKSLNIQQTSNFAVRSVFIDQKYIVTGNDEGIVSLRDRGNCLIREYFGHSDVITCVKIAGGYLYSSGGDHDCSIRKWDILSESCIDVVIGHSSSINSFVVYNKCTVSAGKDKLIRMSECLSQSCVADWVECLIILSDLKSVAAGYSSSGVRIWRDGEVKEVVPVPSKVMSLACCEGVLGIGCWDMKIYVHGEVSLPLIGHTDAVLSLQFLTSFLFSGSADGTIKIWAFQEGYCLNTLYINSGYVHKVISNGRFAIGACGCSLTRIVVWDLENDSNFYFFIQRGRVKALTIAENHFVTGGSENPIIEIWDFEGRLLKSFNKHSEAVTEVCFVADNLISAGEDKWIFVWDWRNDVVVAKYFGFVASGLWCGADRVLACESKGNSLQFYEVNVEGEAKVWMRWRTLKMFECRNSSFKQSRFLQLEEVQELENYTNYIR